MSVHWLGMVKSGMHKGRSDMKAMKGGDKTFGKSGGGQGGVSTKLLSSPMASNTATKFASTAAKGKTTKMAGKS